MTQSFLNKHIYHLDETDEPHSPDPWWQGPGWYYCDENEWLNGAFATEREAMWAYAEYVESLFFGIS